MPITRAAVATASRGVASVSSMQLTLIRHGQPEWTRQGKGQNDPPLTDLGSAQAEALVHALEDPPDRLLVSTLRRAIETVAPLEAKWGLEADRVDWLRELQIPDAWHGAPVDFLEAEFSKARDRLPEDWWDGLPGGESFRDFHGRVVGGLVENLRLWGVTPADHQQLWSVEPDDFHVVIVAHAGTNSTILARLLDIDPVPWEWDRFAMNHAAVTTIATAPVGKGRVFSLRRHSDVSHLGEIRVTA